jgi:hypothetical protein
MGASTFYDQISLLSFLKPLHCVFLQGLNYIFSTNNLVWIYKSNHVNIIFKNEVLGVDSIMSSILA